MKSHVWACSTKIWVMSELEVPRWVMSARTTEICHVRARGSGIWVILEFAVPRCESCQNWQYRVWVMSELAVPSSSHVRAGSTEYDSCQLALPKYESRQCWQYGVWVMSTRSTEIQVTSVLAVPSMGLFRACRLCRQFSFGQLLGVSLWCGCKYWTHFVVVMKVQGKWENSSYVTYPDFICWNCSPIFTKLGRSLWHSKAPCHHTYQFPRISKKTWRTREFGKQDPYIRRCEVTYSNGFWTNMQVFIGQYSCSVYENEMAAVWTLLTWLSIIWWWLMKRLSWLCGIWCDNALRTHYNSRSDYCLQVATMSEIFNLEVMFDRICMWLSRSSVVWNNKNTNRSTYLPTYLSVYQSIYLSFPVCPFLSAIYAPLYNINLCLLFFRSSFLLNFVLYLCVFSLSLHCTFPSSPSLCCRFPIIVSFARVSVSLVYLQSFSLTLLQFLLMTVSLCHCIRVFSLLLFSSR